MSAPSTHNSIANMAAIQTAIANQDSQELNELLGNQPLEPLQKDYLLELAALGNDATIERIIKQTPEKDSAQ